MSVDGDGDGDGDVQGGLTVIGDDGGKRKRDDE